jgi:hypothetical protein
MADTTTTHFAFTLPEVGSSEDTWGTKLNANWAAADTAIFARALTTTTMTASTGLTGGGDLSANRTFALTGAALALHNHATNGLMVRTGAATYAGRTLTQGDGTLVTNGDGVSGNPTVAVDTTVIRTTGNQTLAGTKTFSNQIAASGGIATAADTVGAPGHTWAGDTTTGMYRIAAGQIGFAISGALKATINSTGFSGDGSQLTALNATQLTSGTLPDARLSSDVARRAGTQTFTGANTFSSTVTVSGIATFGDRLRGPDGTAALPTFSFTNDTDTGIFSSGANLIGFATNGVSRITISDAGIAGSGAGLTALNASQLGSGTMPDARLSANVPLKDTAASISGAWTFTNPLTTSTITATGTVTATTFSGSGSALNSLSADQLATGTVPDARLPANLPRLDTAQTWTATQTHTNLTSSIFNGNAESCFKALAADTAALPSFTWSADLDTGMFRVSNNKVGIACAGVEVARFDSNGITANGIGLTALNASNLSSGTVPDARIAATIPRLAASETVTGFWSFSNTLTATTINATTKVLNADGTAALPSITFWSDNDTGFYRSASNEMHVVTGGTSRGHWNSSGLNSAPILALLGNGFRGLGGDTISNPSFTWQGDLTTGLYRAGAGSIGFTVNGVHMGQWNSNGLGGEGRNLTISAAPVAVIEDQKASGTAAQTLSAAVWTTRDLNTLVRNLNTAMALATNAFTPAANGWVEWMTTGYDTFTTRLWNVTDGVVVAMGMPMVTGTTVVNRSFGGAPVVAGKTYRLEQRSASTRAGGAAASQGTEVYSRVKYWYTL